MTRSSAMGSRFIKSAVWSKQYNLISFFANSTEQSEHSLNIHSALNFYCETRSPHLNLGQVRSSIGLPARFYIQRHCVDTLGKE